MKVDANRVQPSAKELADTFASDIQNSIASQKLAP